MRTFREWLLEMSIAKFGDWTEGANFVGEFRHEKLQKYVLLEKFGEFEMYQLRNSLEFIVGITVEKEIQTKQGYETIKNFLVVFNIQFKREKLLDKLGYTKMIRVEGVSTHSDYQRAGIATMVYKYVVNILKYTILSDRKQYFGARKLWARLSKELDIQVDLVDISSKQVIDKNVVLHHGQYDHDFDQRLWSYTKDKENIRAILTSIK